MNPIPTSNYSAGFPPHAASGSSPAGYPFQPQQPFYPSSNNPYLQAQGKAPPIHQQHPVQHVSGGLPMQQAGGSGPGMMPGFPQQVTGPHGGNFSTASFPPTTAPTAAFEEQSSLPATTFQPNFQNMAAFSGPSNMIPGQSQPRPSQPPSQSQPQPTPAPTQAVPPQANQSPQAATREKARITVLLDLNSALLQEVVRLQAAGKSGIPANQSASHQASPSQDASPSTPSSPATLKDPNNANEPHKPGPAAAPGKPSQEYLDCMRRLQANLAYLATVADRAKKPGGMAPAAPAIMTPPPSVPAVKELYEKLNELFPGGAKASSIPPNMQPKMGHPQMSQGNGNFGSMSTPQMAG